MKTVAGWPSNKLAPQDEATYKIALCLGLISLPVPPLGNRLVRGAVIVVLAGALAGSTFGQVTVATASSDTTPFAVSNTDLLQSNLGSAAITAGSGFSFFGSNSLSTLTDGNFGVTGTSNSSVTSVSFQPATAVTFNLDLTASPAGYDLSQIRTYTGWDTGRDGQAYSLAYSTASAPATFLALATVGPFDPASVTGNGNLQVTISDLFAGTLVGNVAALRFIFTSFENNASAWREIDVFGTPTAIPEPSTYAALFGSLSLGFVVFRRYRRAV